MRRSKDSRATPAATGASAADPERDFAESEARDPPLAEVATAWPLFALRQGIVASLAPIHIFRRLAQSQTRRFLAAVERTDRSSDASRHAKALAGMHDALTDGVVEFADAGARTVESAIAARSRRRKAA
jgi:hypothetical protein